MLSIIVTMGKNRAIGKDNKLPWHLPNDLKQIRERTHGKTLILGRKTFEALPEIFSCHRHIVLSNDKDYRIDHNQVTVTNSITDMFAAINHTEENFVIGGATVYEALIPHCNKLYVTLVAESFNADAYFPEIDYKVWKPIIIADGLKDIKNEYFHTFIHYVRR